MEEIHSRLSARGHRIRPCGVEVSNRLARVAHQRFEHLGGHVIHAAANEAISRADPGSADLVVLSSFLEHEHRPLYFLRQVRRILRNEGVVVLKVPNYACWNRYARGDRWCGFRFPDHVNYFTPRTLRILAREAGFSVQQRFSDRLPLSDNMYARLSPVKQP